jgi:hypothetical protein
MREQREAKNAEVVNQEAIFYYKLLIAAGKIAPRLVSGADI